MPAWVAGRAGLSASPSVARVFTFRRERVRQGGVLKSLPTKDSRVVGYVRVSSAQQAESGLSLVAQREKVMGYAKLYDLDLIDIIEDSGVSAKRIARPGLDRALGMLDTGDAEGLVIAKLDRLSRSLKHWNALIDRFFGEKAKKPRRLYSVGDSIDTTSAAGRLVLNMIMAVAQWERETISERTVAALAVKKERNEAIGAKTKLGLARDADGVHLVVDKDEQQTVEAILRMHRGAGLSIREIARKLNDDRVPCRGERWHPTTVHRVLKRVSA